MEQEKMLQEFSCVRITAEDCGLREEWRYEDSVARRPVLLIFRVRKVASGSAKENLCDEETDIFAVRSKSDVNIDVNHRR